MGGLGTGYLEAGADGRFRDVCINHNRKPSDRIPLLDGAFLGVRLASEGRVYAKILAGGAGLPFDTAGIVNPCVPSDSMLCTPLYPGAQYRLNDPRSPVDISWQLLAPVIPFDAEASSLPVILAVVTLTNTREEAYEASALFNWEHCSGWCGESSPDIRGSIRSILIEQEKKLNPQIRDDEPHLPLLGGLVFVPESQDRGQYQSTQALLVRPQPAATVSVMGWDYRSRTELEHFWDHFHNAGRLPNLISRSQKVSAGAVCQHFELAPKETRQIVFSLAWYCPVQIWEDQDIGTAYASRYSGAVEIGQHALKHANYFTKAVGEWQGRFTSSALPGWLARMLINAAHPLTTNTICGADNLFRLVDSWSTDTPIVSLEHFQYASAALACFFPGFSARQLTAFVDQPATESSKPRIRSAVTVVGKSPADAEGTGLFPDPGVALHPLDPLAAFVTTVGRDFTLTGNLPRMLDLYPAFQQALEKGEVWLLRRKPRSDRPHSNDPPVRTFALWLAALLVARNVTMRMKDTAIARECERLFETHRSELENGLWDELQGIYVDAGHIPNNMGQLHGAWFAQMLHIGLPMDPARYVQSVKTLYRLCVKQWGMAVRPGRQVDVPVAGTSLLAVMLAAIGRSEESLKLLKAVRTEVRQQGPGISRLALAWDHGARAPVFPEDDFNHSSTLGIWYAYFGLTGILFDVPGHTLWLDPQLQGAEHGLVLPIFSPLGFGQLRYRRENAEDGLIVQASVSFDSPQSLRTVIMGLPSDTPLHAVICENEDQSVSAKSSIQRDSGRAWLRVDFDYPLMVESRLFVNARLERLP